MVDIFYRRTLFLLKVDAKDTKLPKGTMVRFQRKFLEMSPVQRTFMLRQFKKEAHSTLEYLKEEKVSMIRAIEWYQRSMLMLSITGIMTILFPNIYTTILMIGACSCVSLSYMSIEVWKYEILACREAKIKLMYSLSVE